MSVDAYAYYYDVRRTTDFRCRPRGFFVSRCPFGYLSPVNQTVETGHPTHPEQPEQWTPERYFLVFMKLAFRQRIKAGK